MGLRMDGIGGGQFKQLTKQIIELESQPIRQMEGRKAKEETKFKLFQEFKSKFTQLDRVLKDLTTPRKFRELKVDLGQGEDLVSITLDKDLAEPGQYELEVDQLAQRTSVISNGFTSPDETYIGSGFITMDLSNGESIEITIQESQGTLKGIASAINQYPNSPVRAAIIRDVEDPEAPWKLLVTAKKDGEAEQIEFPTFYFSGGDEDFYIDNDRESQNASLSIDGFEMEASSNQIQNFLPGVNLHLLQKKEDFPFLLSITEDYEKMAGKVKELIDQLNPILEFIIKQNTMDDRTDTTITFGGDGSLQMIEYRIRNLIHSPYTVFDQATDDHTTFRLNELGIEFEKNGLLTFKMERFQKAIEDRSEMVTQAVSGPEGFVNQLAQVILNYTRVFRGTLALKEQGIRSRIDDIDRQIEQKNRFLDQKKQQITQQFARLESTLGSLQQQQQSLSAILPGSGGGLMQLIGGGG